MLRGRLAAAVTLAFLCAVFGCGKTPAPPAASIPAAPQAVGETIGVRAVPEVNAGEKTDKSAPAAPRENYPEVIIQTTAGDIHVRLNLEKAVITVDNFLRNYVDHDFYAGTVFHHIEKGFLIIGGGYTAEGLPKATRTPIHNESYNGLKNRRGSIAMARDAQYADSATSQFFINLVDNPDLDYHEGKESPQFGYCVFGEVIKGLDVVDRMAEMPVKQSGDFPMMPVEPVAIRSIKRIK